MALSDGRCVVCNDSWDQRVSDLSDGRCVVCNDRVEHVNVGINWS